jgi:hypothetical protein
MDVSASCHGRDISLDGEGVEAMTSTRRLILEPDSATRLQASIATTAYTTGATHDYYHYPARFSPEVARAVIQEFSAPGDWVLDPFMGGGTSVVEGLLLGRRVIGTDLNALAHFVSTVRTRPLSPWDQVVLRDWAREVAERLVEPQLGWIERPRLRNLPPPVETFMAGALHLAQDLYPRQLTFARAALLRLGQWCLESRGSKQPRRRRLALQLPVLLERMFVGMDDFVAGCAAVGVSKRRIQRRRILLHRSAVGLDEDERLARHRGLPRLVFTSPPYPGVNVLYHRWQHRGRRETPAPYWIASVPDGYTASHYTGGSRTPTGVANYFTMIVQAFRSVGRFIDPRGHVVQLVGFSQAETQLPVYLECMRMAGFEECEVGDGRLARRVPNRRWYSRVRDASGHVNDAATEYLLIHRLKR